MEAVISVDNVQRIIDRLNGRSGSVIAILEDIQSEYGYLPEAALRAVARTTGRSLVELYGVATFYSCFSLRPRGRHVVSVCTGTACHVRGSPRVLGTFERALGLKAGETSEDGEFTLTTVNCLGACALGPVAVVDGHYHGRCANGTVPGLVDRLRRKDASEEEAVDEAAFRVDVSCPQCNRSLMSQDRLLDGQPMVHVTVSFNRTHGWLRLSGLYGDHRIESEHEIPEDSVVSFFCPRCHAELRSTRQCPSCDAPMVPLLARKGGIVQICSRRGCKEHLLDLCA